MARVLNSNKVPNALVIHPGEGHGENMIHWTLCGTINIKPFHLHRILLGFRRTENIIRTLELELWFYGQIFGFSVEGIKGIEISNMPKQ